MKTKVTIIICLCLIISLLVILVAVTIQYNTAKKEVRELRYNLDNTISVLSSAIEIYDYQNNQLIQYNNQLVGQLISK